MRQIAKQDLYLYIDMRRECQECQEATNDEMMRHVTVLQGVKQVGSRHTIGKANR